MKKANKILLTKKGRSEPKLKSLEFETITAKFTSKSREIAISKIHVSLAN